MDIWTILMGVGVEVVLKTRGTWVGDVRGTPWAPLLKYIFLNPTPRSSKKIKVKIIISPFLGPEEISVPSTGVGERSERTCLKNSMMK